MGRTHESIRNTPSPKDYVEKLRKRLSEAKTSVPGSFVFASEELSRKRQKCVDRSRKMDGKRGTREGMKADRDEATRICARIPQQQRVGKLMVGQSPKTFPLHNSSSGISISRTNRDAIFIRWTRARFQISAGKYDIE